MHSLTADSFVPRGKVHGQDLAVEVDRLVVFPADQRLDQSMGCASLRRAVATKLWIEKCLASASPTFAHVIADATGTVHVEEGKRSAPLAWPVVLQIKRVAGEVL